jgi:signal transduction histidine kinase
MSVPFQFHSFFNGIVFFQLFYVLFLAFHGKNRLFLLYAVYLAVLLVYFSYIALYMKKPLLFSNDYWAQAFYERLSQWLPGCLVILYTFFFRKMLRLEQEHPYIGRVSFLSQRCIGWLMVLDFIFFLLKENEYSRIFYFITTIVFFLVSVYCIIGVFGKAKGYAQFIVWGGLVICVTASLVSLLIIFYGSMKLANAGRFFIIVESGTLLETFLFTCGISYRHFMAEREKAVLAESLHHMRNKISADLHDHIGSSLSAIAIFSKVAGDRVQDPTYTAASLQKIEDKSLQALSEMNDVVWLINPVNDSMDKLLTRMKDHALSLLSPLGIGFSYNTTGAIDTMVIPMEERKALFLVYKEALNNAVKYAGCSELQVSLVRTNGKLQMEIFDNGSGFDVHSIKKGNGLLNMKRRAEDLQGQCVLDTLPGKGTRVQFSLPVK